MKNRLHIIKFKNNVMKVKTKKITFTPTYTKKNQQLLQHSQKQSAKTTKQSPVPQHMRYQNGQSTKEDDFLNNINGYIDELRGGDKVQLGQIRKRIQKQKLINRELYWNIIQIQKTLLKRTQKLQQIQKMVYSVPVQQDSQNYFKFKSQIETQICSDSLEESEFEEGEEEEYQETSKRRKTEIPIPLQKLILRQKEEKGRNRTKEKYRY